MRGDARNVDDRTSVASHHRRAEFLAGQQYAANEIEVEVRLPISQGDLFEWKLGSNCDFRIISASGVYENSWCAKRFLNRLMCYLKALSINRISREEPCVPALTPNASHPRLAA